MFDGQLLFQAQAQPPGPPLNLLGGPIGLLALGVAMFAFFAQALNRQSELRARGEKPRFDDTETAFRIALLVAIVAILLLSVRLLLTVGDAIYQVWGWHWFESTAADTNTLLTRLDSLAVADFVLLAVGISVTSVGYIFPLFEGPLRLFNGSARPRSAHRTSPPPNADGWNRTNVLVQLTIVPGQGTLVYTASGATVIQETTVVGSSASFTVTAEGETGISHWAVDSRNRQTTPQHVQIRIEKTPPTT